MEEFLSTQLQKLRKPLLRIASEHGTPCYVYDPSEARKNLKEFSDAFRRAGAPVTVYYAIKSNHYPGLLRTLVEEGAGLDASSTRELTLALEAGASRILLTGPAKQEEELSFACAHSDRITVNLETLRELKVLSRMAHERGVEVRCGLRVTTSAQSGWTKFGLPLVALRAFADEAQRLPSVRFCGIHFHISFLRDPERYTATITEIAQYMKENFSPEERARFEYLDIGGGMYPADSPERLYPWNPTMEHAHVSDDTLEQMLTDENAPRTLPFGITPLTTFASDIAKVTKEQIKPLLPNASLLAEPGRIISHSVMHMLFTLIENKSPQMGIVDGGTNMIGWEKYQYFTYAPLFNLTHFSLEREIPFLLYGSLCTPADVWGYSLHCSAVEEGDIICLPFQGAYTYTFAQQFIREIPPVVELSHK